jgi:uncharacterized protein (DUF885 family)
MEITRRDLMAGAGAMALGSALPSPAHAANDPIPAVTGLLDTIADGLLADYPEVALGLGIDKGERQRLRNRLTDRSRAAEDDRARRAAATAARLRAIPRNGLPPAAALDIDVAEAAFTLAVEGWQAMPVGDVAVLNAEHSYASTPYLISQNSGAYVSVPTLLEERHTVAGRADADAYLARIEALAAAIDGETARLAADQAKGAVLPGFLSDIAVGQITGMQGQPAAQWSLVRSFADKCERAGLGTAPAGRAAALVKERVAPALGRQAAALGRARPSASDEAGIWARPGGDAWYAWLVKAATTTAMSAEDMHALGVEQNRALTAEIDTLLKAQGLTKGTVGARLTALGKRPDLLFSNDDAGRAKLLAYLNGRIADIRPRLPKAFAKLAKGNLVIKRVPPEIEAGMPDGYAGPGTIDGTIPGTYYINLKDTANWPRFSLPTLCYHEGIPGHVWQGEYTYKLPLLRTLLAFNAYQEGWALYAEQLGDELGCYADDPLGRIGYLQSINFRACRLVVDTGIHAKRWSFDQALDWFATGTGMPREQLRAELNRYCAWPGQACGYKMGHNEIVRLRSHAERALGNRFDVRTYDDAVLLGGNMPLTMLARVVERYIAAAGA